MFRFTIRDVLWLTVVVAMAATWHGDRNAAWRFARQQIARQENERVVLANNRQRALDAENQVTRAQQEIARLKEEALEKQLQIEQLLTAPSAASKEDEK